MIGYLDYYGLVIPDVYLRKKLGNKYNKYLNGLTVTTFQIVGPAKVTKLWTKDIKNNICYVYLPRTELLTLDIPINIKYESFDFTPIPLLIDLFTNQKIIVETLKQKYTSDNIQRGTASVYLTMKAGYGKSYVAGGIIAELGVKCVYIVPKCPLEIQAVKDLQLCIGNDNVCSYKQYKQCLVTVIVINTALTLDKTFYSQFKFVIFDEVHTYCSDTRRKIFKKISAPICLGMTATPDSRLDQLDVIAIRELAFDGILYANQIPGFSYDDVRFTTEVTIVKYYGPPEHTKTLKHQSTDMMFTPYMTTQAMSDPYRLRLVTNYLKQLYQENRNIYVFSEERESLSTLYDSFSAMFDNVYAPELSCGKFIGGITDKEIIYIKQNIRVLLTTYAYSSTGISIDRMDSIIFMTPRKSNMEQILGRILRRTGDVNITRKIIDITDMLTPLKNQLRHRLAAYKYYNMNINKVIINWESIQLYI